MIAEENSTEIMNEDNDIKRLNVMAALHGITSRMTGVMEHINEIKDNQINNINAQDVADLKMCALMVVLLVHKLLKRLEKEAE